MITHAVQKWTWDVDIRKMVDHFVVVETKDGGFRHGRISDVHVRKVLINETVFEIPDSITLNGDSSDVIDFRSIKKMELS